MSVNDRLEIAETLQPGKGGREVRNETQLADWLRERPPRDGVVIAVRAALRCLWAPICSARDKEPFSLIGFRVCLLGVIGASEEGRTNAPSAARVQRDSALR